MAQSYANHTRWLVPYHFVVAPLLIINLGLTVRTAIREPSAAAWWGVVVAVAILLGISLARVQALTVQDRMIRLEETLRLQRLLPPGEHGDIGKLSRRQFVALRFASDAELPALFRRVRAGELVDAKAIKQAVTAWRPDELRA
ncbi:MAG: hypothetical protein IT359_13175 [Gemmatimonadaceae bacterium]|nr:hypothetical protein [Gemmatimonadaceae bacterium]